MRKYQQLALVIISFCSVGFLLTYKTENTRLRYVLQVINYFGRQDVVAMHKLNNGTNLGMPSDLASPLPVWQSIGVGSLFYAYAAFWSRNELVAGGEAHTIVVGKQGAIINFQCNLIYDRGRKSIQGKFRFQRGTNESVIDDMSSTFTSYNFFCRITRDFGMPESVNFVDRTSSNQAIANKLRLRYLKPKASLNITKSLPLTVCVDFVNYNKTSLFSEKEEYLQQFFLFHQAQGIQHFIIYDFDEVPSLTVRLLQGTSLQLYQLPFNFPFTSKNTSASRLRHLIETDCLQRNLNRAHHTVLLMPNEFLYLNTEDSSDISLQNFLRSYKESHNLVSSYSVCLNDVHRLLMDKSLYDLEQIADHNVYLYGLEGSSGQILAPNRKTNPVSLSEAFIHRFIDCRKVGPDGLHDWRKSVRENFMKRIVAARNEVHLYELPSNMLS